MIWIEKANWCECVIETYLCGLDAGELPLLILVPEDEEWATLFVERQVSNRSHI